MKVRTIGKSGGLKDLTKRMQILKNDEIGELATWFNQFLDKLERTEPVAERFDTF